MPAEKSAMVAFLRGIIRSASPKITERIAYGVPFFYCEKPLCYFNCKPEGCDVGFTSGYLLKQRPELHSEKRKFVRSLFFKWDEDVDIELLKQVLAESLDLPKYQATKR